MSNSANLKKLLSAVKRAKRPLSPKNTEKTESVSLFGGLKVAKDSQPGLSAQIGMIDSFTRAKKSLAAINQELKTAKLNAGMLPQSGPPTRAQAGQLNREYKRVNRLQQKRDVAKETLKARRDMLKETGISPADAQKSKIALQEKKSSLQAKQKARIEQISALGSSSLKFATGGFNLGKKLLMNGYEQSLKKNDSPLASDITGHLAPGDSDSLRAPETSRLQMSYQQQNNPVGTVNSDPTASVRANAAISGTGAGADLQTIQSSYQTQGAADVFNIQIEENSGSGSPGPQTAPDSRAAAGLQIIQSSFQTLNGAQALPSLDPKSPVGLLTGLANSPVRAASSGLQVVQSCYQVMNGPPAPVGQGAEMTAASQEIQQPHGSASDLHAIGTSYQTLNTPATLPSKSAPGSAPGGTQGSNLGTDLQGLQEVWQSLSVDIFSQQESSLRSLVQTATLYLGQLQQWVQNNQGLARTFGVIAAVVIGVAGAIGFVASVVAPVISGIGILITVATTVGSVFATVFGAIGVVIAAIGSPIAIVGLMVAGVIAFVLAKIGILNKTWEAIVSAYDKVKEKLGLGSADASAPPPDAAVGALGIASDPKLLKSGAQASNFNHYQAVTPAASNSFTDQSQTAFNITLQGDTAPGSDSQRQLMAILEQHEDNKRNKSLSQFGRMGGLAR